MSEKKYYGIHACQVLWEKRPGDIIRVYIDQPLLKNFSSLLKWCAANRKAYHIISSNELDKVSDSVHHEGICILAKDLKPLSFKSLLLEKWPEKVCLLYLDGIENPHNLGSILRTAAHFGVPYILGSHLPIPPSAYRIAKGAAERVQRVELEKPLETIRSLQAKGFALVATSSHKGIPLPRFSFPSRTILAVGSESKGISSKLLKEATTSICIEGTGVMESLNVAVATGILLSAYRSQ